jgi:hypothetical protein
MRYRRNGTTYRKNEVLVTRNQSITYILDDVTGEMPSLNTEQSQSYNVSKFESDYDIRNKWQKSQALAVFILSAIGNNLSNIEGYQHEIKLNGWHGAKHRLTVIKCCVLLVNGTIKHYLNPNKTTRGKRLNLVATQLTCPIKSSLMDVTGVAVEFAKKKCPTKNSDYIVPFIPKRQPKRHSFAICLKILYGNVDNKLLIDWIEFYREIKVDKVFTFVYNITEDTKKIIQYYERLGFLETRQFAFPWKKGRKFSFTCFILHFGYLKFVCIQVTLNKYNAIKDECLQIVRSISENVLI